MKIIRFLSFRFLPVWRRKISLGLFTALIFTAPTLTSAQTVEWVRQWGTSDCDFSGGVSADGLGNVYISGSTGENTGGWDAFIRKYDASGTLLWTELGTSNCDSSSGVSADGSGNVYISGSTYGSLGGPNAGGLDAFVRKYNASGTLLWTEQLGTSGDEYSSSVSADGLGNVYISGATYGSLGGPSAGSQDAFISKYNASGTLLWTEQLGTSGDDYSRGVSADGLGNVYITGATEGSLEGPNAGNFDAFVSKYNASGTLLWTKQLGTSGLDISHGVSADGLGNVYISGLTTDSLGGPSAGSWDAFISKYDASGTLLWTEQLGTSECDRSYGVSADEFGNVYISGGTDGSLEGSNAGSGDVFISKYDASGTLLWTEQFGNRGDDRSFSVSADGLGNVYFSGYTMSGLVRASAGSCDAFVGKICDVPEPSGVVGLLGLCLAGLIAAARRRGLRL